ncbi:DUF859 family phage minor structural protein [Atopobacter phocae]|uniref:DUF859 family phage minor structural protein n=1 Tax=Atopobacter phocae TaxID=136492 RepID=UPI000472F8E9|nr:DUF859 family phage minor structural protein [Atopobacter phocae]
MATYIGNQPGGFYAQFKIDLDVASQDVASNRTRINYKIYLQSVGGGYPFNQVPQPFSMYANGQTIFNTSTPYKVPRNGSQTLKTGSFEVTHNSDGTKSFTFEVYLTTHRGQTAIKGSMSLPTLLRGSDFNLPETVDAGSNLKIQINRKSGDFKHSIRYSYAGTEGNIASMIDSTTYDYQVPTKFIDLIPNATQNGMAIIVDTYSGNRLIGSKTQYTTVKFPSYITPTIDDISFNDVGTRGRYLDGYYQLLSDIKFNIRAKGMHGSTIQSIQTSFDGRVQSGTNPVFTSISQSGSLTANVEVTDSRGRKASKSKTVTVKPYDPPTITAFRVVRGDPNATLARVFLGGKFFKTKSADKLSIKVATSQAGKNNWITKYESTTTQSTFNLNPYLSGTFETSVAYDVRLTISDSYYNRERIITLAPTSVVMAFGADDDSIGMLGRGEIPNAVQIFGNGIYDKDKNKYITKKDLDNKNFATAANINDKAQAIESKLNKIVRMGSNANGHYYYFDNGLAICHGRGKVGMTSSLGHGGLNRTNYKRIVYPINFKTTDVAVSVSVASGSTMIAHGGVNRENFDVYFITAGVRNMSNETYNYTAIGRWK